MENIVENMKKCVLTINDFYVYLFVCFAYLYVLMLSGQLLDIEIFRHSLFELGRRRSGRSFFYKFFIDGLK